MRTIALGSDVVGTVFSTGMFNGNIITGTWRVVRFEMDGKLRMAICERVR